MMHLQGKLKYKMPVLQILRQSPLEGTNVDHYITQLVSPYLLATTIRWRCWPKI